jgi:hypothetical protein
MRRLLSVAVGLVLGVGVLVACNSADFTPAIPKDCTKVECTCEEDPTQPTCKAVPGQPDGGLEASTFDATPPADANVETDASTDAADDAADAADQ